MPVVTPVAEPAANQFESKLLGWCDDGIPDDGEFAGPDNDLPCLTTAVDGRAPDLRERRMTRTCTGCVYATAAILYAAWRPGRTPACYLPDDGSGQRMVLRLRHGYWRSALPMKCASSLATYKDLGSGTRRAVMALAGIGDPTAVGEHRAGRSSAPFSCPSDKLHARKGREQ